MAAPKKNVKQPIKKTVQPAAKPAKVVHAPKEIKQKSFYIALIIFAFILYGNTLYNKYSMDDDFVTNNNQTIQKGVSGIPEIFQTRYSEGKYQYEYRPIVKSIFAIEYEIFGMNPGVSHFFNILLYALTCVLLFYLLRKFLKNFPVILPFIITLLFMAHPLHTEVVASLKNRDEMLSFFGCLLSLHFFIKYTENKKVLNIVAGILIYLLAYLSKQSALTFLVIIPLALYFFTDIKLKTLLIILGSLAIIAIAIRIGTNRFLPQSVRDIFYFENPLFFMKGRIARIPTALITLLFYIKILIFPHPLVFYYGYDQVPIPGWSDPWIYVSLILYLAMFVWAIMNFKKKHILSFAILYYLINISMYSNFVKPAMGIVAERYAYAASLGFAIVVGYLLYKIFKIDFSKPLISQDARRKVIMVVSIILILYSYKTIGRNFDWKTELSLYEADLPYLNNSAKANALYAGTLLADVRRNMQQPNAKQKIELAVKHYNRAIEIYPKYATAYNNLGTIYFSIYRQYDKAIPYFKKAVEVFPEYYEAYHNLGYAHELLGDTTSAILYYNKSILAKKDYILPYSNISMIEFKRGNFEKAVAMNEKMMKLDPSSDVPYVNIGNFYLMRSDTTTAVRYWEKAVEKFPSNSQLIGNLVKYYQQKGDMSKVNYYQGMINQNELKRNKAEY
ncbi:MAG: tetratricopeptide repeat protein [Bacteroidota bacterium]